MNGTNLFKIALKAINNNKLRSFLTMLGIIIGVGSVIAMLAIGQGSKQSIKKNISEMAFAPSSFSMISCERRISMRSIVCASTRIRSSIASSA